MALPDTYIRSWHRIAAENDPKGVTPVGDMLAGQLQNIKSVVREWSLSFGWLTTDLPGVPSGANTFVYDGVPAILGVVSRRIMLTMSNGKIWYGFISAGALVVTPPGVELTVTFDPGSGPFTVGTGVTIVDWAVSALGAKPSTMPLDHWVTDVTITGPARRSAALVHPWPVTGSGVVLVDDIRATLLSPAVGTGNVTSSICYPVQVGTSFYIELPVAPAAATVVTCRVVVNHGSAPWPE